MAAGRRGSRFYSRCAYARIMKMHIKLKGQPSGLCALWLKLFILPAAARTLSPARESGIENMCKALPGAMVLHKIAP